MAAHTGWLRAIAARILTLALLAWPSGASLHAGQTRVAVAANFRGPAEEIARAFAAETAERVVFSFGSTGNLYAQISQGAPFDVLLSADQDRARKAVDSGLAVQGSRFTYAIGRLALYSSDGTLVTGPRTLSTTRFAKLAIAQPASAPYGSAAIETMRRLGVLDRLNERLVRGLNVAQAFQFVYSGSAELGFVALSQVVKRSEGSMWVVPENLHSPIAQDAVLLETGASNVVARAFLDFLGGPRAGRIIAEYGYGPGW